MTLAAGLYKSQDQQEQDLTQGPGWTIDDQKPSVFGGLAEAIPRGIGEGAAAGISMLTHGIHEAIPALMQANPFVRLMQGNEAVKTLPGVETAMQIPGALTEAEISTRNVAKDMVGDPRTTGAAANVIEGFSKAATEFTVGSLAGGPAAGATLLGATDGYAHYADLLDQGVDHETAAKSGVLTAMTSGAGALLPMGMPAKWLAGLSTAGTFAAQAGAGSVINASFGAASRYASAKILADAGYPEMADQQKPWDATNVLTDAITGMFFGAHAGWHGLKHLDASNVDPSIRDAAKVVQDRQEVNERAPGVPVDMASAAVHRQALETALGDLMTGKPVDLSDVKTEGATFARPEVDETAATQIIRDAFVKSGVLDDAAQFDRWLTGDQEIEATTPEPKSQKEAAPPESVKPEPAAEAGGYDVGEGELTDEQRKAFGLPALGEVGERPEGAGKESSVLSRADRRGSPSEGVKVYRGSRRPLSDADFEGEALGHSTGNPTSGTGVWFTTDSAEATRWGTVSEHSLHLENPKVIKGESFPEFDSLADANAYQKKLIAEGHDGILMKNSHFGGKDHYVAFSPEALKAAEAKPIRVGPLADRPDLQIVNEHGEALHAGDEQQRALDEEAQANKEAEPMFNAAVGCEARHQ